MKNAFYETDLTDAQWEYLQPMLPKRKNLAGPDRSSPGAQRHPVGAQGRPPEAVAAPNFPPWQTAYDVFHAWSRDDTWASLNDALRLCVRLDADRNRQPSTAILDSQSVKSDGHGGAVGCDAGKQIKGRKRHLLVDTLGLVLGVIVIPADCPERRGRSR